jgi:hypothetical protein
MAENFERPAMVKDRVGLMHLVDSDLGRYWTQYWADHPDERAGLAASRFCAARCAGGQHSDLEEIAAGRSRAHASSKNAIGSP